MMNFAALQFLLSTCCWISTSASEFRTVEVQPGEEVTLLCSNFSRVPSHLTWFKLANGPNISCISSMITPDVNATVCAGYQHEKFYMTSNTTTIFLTLHRVDLSDSGLYFCGVRSNEHPVIVSATYLKVKEMLEGTTNLILGTLIAALMMAVIGLVVKIRTLQRTHKDRQNPQNNEDLGSDALIYAQVGFALRAKPSRRPASEDQLETNVVYAAPRQTQDTSGTLAHCEN